MISKSIASFWKSNKPGLEANVGKTHWMIKACFKQKIVHVKRQLNIPFALKFVLHSNSSINAHNLWKML